MKSIVLNLTQKCNAQCAHCCFGCLPDSVNYLTNPEIEKIIHYAESHEDVKVISLTGGEALLQKAEVLNITKRLSSVGKEVTLISNGFWATNDRTTRRILTELTEAGLTYLTISFDDYHAKYIPVENIRRLLTISKEFEMEVAMNMVADKTNQGIGLLEQLGESIFGIQITVVPASPVGRAKGINSDDLYFKAITDLDLSCPATGWEFVVHHDGYIYPCCSPSVFESELRLGNIADASIESLEKKFYSNILLYILKEEGLNWFIEKMHLDMSDMTFVSTCEICKYIFSDINRINSIKNDMKLYYDEKFESI